MTFLSHKIASVWVGPSHLRIQRFHEFRQINNIVIRTQKCKAIRIRVVLNINLDLREITISIKAPVRWCVIDHDQLRMVMILKMIKMAIVVARGNVDHQKLVVATEMAADRVVDMIMTHKVTCRPSRTWVNLQVFK